MFRNALGRQVGRKMNLQFGGLPILVTAFLSICGFFHELALKGLQLLCLPEDVKAKHDKDCVAFGLERKSDGYFTCRMFFAEMYRNSEVLKLMQKSPLGFMPDDRK
jgi:hypothetical protein